MDSDISTESLFQLSNGKYILSEDLSHKMTIIKKAQPESIQDDSTGYSWDECGMAELFSECYQQDTRFCREQKMWYTYYDGAWRRDIGSLLVSEKVKEFVRLMNLYCGEIADDEKRKNYFKLVTKMGDRRFRDRIMRDAEGVCMISAAEFDSHPNLINCLNGTYDLDNFSFREHSWKDLLTMQTRIEYTALGSVSCPRWEKFISEVMEGNEEKANYLQRALGYSLLGTSKEECMFILWGKTTRNGKSTLLSTIHHMLGDYAAVSPVSIICRTDRAKNAEAASPTLAALKGKRFVTMAESDQYGRFDEETIKQLTGGEEISARNLYEHQMSYLPQFTLWLSCNDLPAVNDKSLFASDRLRVIEFTKHFSDVERDPTLKDHFRTKDAMRGIFSWLIQGYAMYMVEGLAMPCSIRSTVSAYERANDVVVQFLEDRCEKDPTGTVRVRSIYDTYKMWCRSNGMWCMDKRRFLSGLDAHPEWHEGLSGSGAETHYKGLKLKG